MTTATSSSARRILIVDDEPAVRTAISDLLTAAGHVVVAAVGDGEQAIAAAIRHQPDAVVTDLRMPGISGVELARVLGDLIPDLPVVVLTAFDDLQLQLAVEHAGAASFLVKGCPAREVFDAIDRCPQRGYVESHWPSREVGAER